MRAESQYWTAGAEFRRTLSTDARLVGVDMVYGLIYAGASILLPSIDPVLVGMPAVVPYIALALVLVYMVQRICGPETRAETAMFYSNLPRRRVITVWSHTAFLAAYTLIAETLVVIGTNVYLGGASSMSESAAAQIMLFVPFIALGYVIWSTYSRIGSATSILLISMGAALLVFVITQLSIVSLSGETPWLVAYGFGAALLAIGIWLVFNAANHWAKTQVGELA